MLKRALIAGVVGVGLVAFQSGDASASRLIRVGGIWVEWGSVITWTAITKLSNSPSETWRSANTITTIPEAGVAIYCVNPNDHEGTGAAYFGPRVVSEATDLFGPEGPGGRKKKGVAYANPTQVLEPLFPPEIWCPNGNWSVQRALPLAWNYDNRIQVPDGSGGWRTIDILQGVCTVPDFDERDLDAWPQPGDTLNLNNEDCTISYRFHDETYK